MIGQRAVSTGEIKTGALWPCVRQVALDARHYASLSTPRKDGSLRALKLFGAECRHRHVGVQAGKSDPQALGTGLSRSISGVTVGAKAPPADARGATSPCLW